MQRTSFGSLTYDFQSSDDGKVAAEVFFKRVIGKTFKDFGVQELFDLPKCLHQLLPLHLPL
jgi:hypothetical protein